MVLCLDLIQANAVTSPGEWPSHVPFAWWLWCGQTSSILGMGSVTAEVPTLDIHLRRHQHLATFLPPIWRCLSPVLAFWQQLSWPYDLHI